MVAPLGPLVAATRVVKARAQRILNCILLALLKILNLGDCLNENSAMTIAIFIQISDTRRLIIRIWVGCGYAYLITKKLHEKTASESESDSESFAVLKAPQRPQNKI